MKKVERFQSEDGREYKTEIEAVTADSYYWKQRAVKAEQQIELATNKLHQPYADSGGHQ